MAKRLFDFVEKRATLYPNDILLAAKEKGQWRTYSSLEVWETAQKLAGGLQNLGINTADSSEIGIEKIALISANRPEWLITDIAVQLTSAVLTPIYPTINPSEFEYVMNEAGVSKIIISNLEIYNRFKNVFQNIPTLKHIISIDPIENLLSIQDLINENLVPNAAIIKAIDEEHLATIIYTSGTTGNPKGVMLSHKNIVSNVIDSMPEFSFAERNAKALSFLPLNHIFEKMVSYLYLDAGIAIYYAESMDTIGENLREIKPIVFSTVPRLLEKVYERILANAMTLKGIKRGIFFWALALGKTYDNQVNQGVVYNLQLKLANKLVFSKWRAALGGNIRAIVTGSAACQERLMRIFSAAQMPVMEGYGLTETSPVISVTRFESKGRKIGTVGAPIKNVRVKMAEDGEILVQGNNVMLGYFKQPELTAEVLTNNWFHTGDIGVWDGENIKITDRKKEIFKTSGGKYVSPQAIENKMRESPFIEQIMVIGDNKKFVSALIIPSFTNLKTYFADHKITVSQNPEEMTNEAEVIQLLNKQIDKLNQQLNKVEQVKKFKLLPVEWKIETGELTPSLKIKRKIISQKYNAQIEELYA